MIVGDGPLRDELQGRIQRARLDQHVQLVGRVDDRTLTALYQAAWLSVVPSVQLEGFGLVVLESLACGVPSVVTDVDGLGEVPRELDPSMVVRAGDAGALASRLVAAFDGTAPLPDSATCRGFAEQFTWVSVVEAYEDLVTELADRG